MSYIIYKSFLKFEKYILVRFLLILENSVFDLNGIICQTELGYFTIQYNIIHKHSKQKQK